MSKNKSTQKINKRQIKQDIRKKQSYLGLIFVCLAVVAIIGVILITFWGKETEANLVVTPDNVEEIIASIKEEERTPIGAYEVSMTSQWEFKDGEAISKNAYVENCPRNNNEVYFVVKLEDTGEEIYKSPYIPVGSSLENIMLDTNLKKGTYKAVLTYYLVDNSYKKVSEVAVGITIIVKK